MRICAGYALCLECLADLGGKVELNAPVVACLCPYADSNDYSGITKICNASEYVLVGLYVSVSRSNALCNLASLFGIGFISNAEIHINT